MPISEDKIINVDGKKAVFISPDDPELGGLCIFGHRHGDRVLRHRFPNYTGSESGEYVSPSPHHAFWAEFAYKCLSFIKDRNGDAKEQEALNEFLQQLQRIPKDYGVLQANSAVSLFEAVLKKHGCDPKKYLVIFSSDENDIRRQMYEKVYQNLLATYEDLADIANQAYDDNIHLYTGYVIAPEAKDYTDISDYIITKLAGNNSAHKLSPSYIRESKEVFAKRAEILASRAGVSRESSDAESGLRRLREIKRRLDAEDDQREGLGSGRLQAELDRVESEGEAPDSDMVKLARLRESLSKPAPRRGMQVGARRKLKQVDELAELRERLLERKPRSITSSSADRGAMRKVDDFYVTSSNVPKRLWDNAQRSVLTHISDIKDKVERGSILVSDDLVNVGISDPRVAKSFYNSLSVESSENSVVISGISEQGVIRSNFSLTIEYDRSEKEIVQQLSGDVEPSDCELLLAMQVQAKIAIETKKRKFVIDGNVEFETIIKCIQIGNCIGLEPELEGAAKVIVLESLQKSGIPQESIDEEYLKLLQSKGPYEQNSKIMAMSIDDSMGDKPKKGLTFRGG